MNKLTLSLALCVGVTACVHAQVNTFDRNLQLLDSIQSTAARGPFAAMTAQKPNSYTLAGNVTVPDTAFRLGASFIYSFTPNGNTGLYQFQSTSSYSHANPSGGSVSDQLSETFSYQIMPKASGGLSTNGLLSSLTIGAIGTTVNNGVSAIAPFASTTYDVTTELHVAPRATYQHANGGGSVSDGWVPDYSLLYTPERMKSLKLSVGYTCPTSVTGSYSYNGALIYALSSQLSLRVAASGADGIQSTYSAQLGWKF